MKHEREKPTDNAVYQSTDVRVTHCDISRLFNMYVDDICTVFMQALSGQPILFRLGQPVSNKCPTEAGVENEHTVSE